MNRVSYHLSLITLLMTLSVTIKKRLGPAFGEEFTLDVEFHAAPGVTILFGASGSGKTMTLKCIAGILRPDSGKITVAEESLFDSKRAVDLPIRGRNIGYVFQNLALFPHLSARENVEFSLNDLPRGQRSERAAAMMKAFHIEHTADRRPRHISGGEAQRVALARALVARPRILLLDEPLSAIDEATKLGIVSDLKTINRDLRIPIIYVTHSRDEAIALGDRVIVYERGRIITSGEPLEVFGAPITSSVARLTGVENIFDGCIVSKNEAAGTMTVAIAGLDTPVRIEVPFADKQVNDRVKLAVPAGDILIATEEPRNTSARNRLRGRIREIEDKSNRTVVRVESGVIWNASITRQAVKELALSIDRDVWLAFKTHSCYLLDE